MVMVMASRFGFAESGFEHFSERGSSGLGKVRWRFVGANSWHCRILYTGRGRHV